MFLSGFRRASLNLQNSRGVPIPDINIRRASPDESKVSVANLSPIPPPSPPPPPPEDWTDVVDSLNPAKLLSAVQERHAKSDEDPDGNDAASQRDAAPGCFFLSTASASVNDSALRRSIFVPGGNIHGDMDARTSRDDTQNFVLVPKGSVSANDASFTDRSVYVLKGIGGNSSRAPKDGDRCVLINRVSSLVEDRTSIEELHSKFSNGNSNSDRALSLCTVDALVTNEKDERDPESPSNHGISISKVTTAAGDMLPNEKLLSANFRCPSVPMVDSSKKRKLSDNTLSTVADSTSKLRNNNKSLLGSADYDIQASKVRSRDCRGDEVINKKDSSDLSNIYNVHSETFNPTESKSAPETKSETESSDAKVYSNSAFIKRQGEQDQERESIVVLNSENESPSVFIRIKDSSLSSSDRINDNSESTSLGCKK